MCHPRCLGCWPSWVYPRDPRGEGEVRPAYPHRAWLGRGEAVPRLTRIWTVRSPSPASRASMVNSTGRLAGMPEALRPGPLARTLLASWAGSTLILKGLEKQKEWIVVRELGLENREPSHTWAEVGGLCRAAWRGHFPGPGDVLSLGEGSLKDSLNRVFSPEGRCY